MSVRLLHGLPFENDVKTYGTETLLSALEKWRVFENDVKTYGTETKGKKGVLIRAFENDVKTYGTETFIWKDACNGSLRMM